MTSEPKKPKRKESITSLKKKIRDLQNEMEDNWNLYHYKRQLDDLVKGHLNFKMYEIRFNGEFCYWVPDDMCWESPCRLYALDPKHAEAIMNKKMVIFELLDIKTVAF